MAHGGCVHTGRCEYTKCSECADTKEPFDIKKEPWRDGCNVEVVAGESSCTRVEAVVETHDTDSRRHGDSAQLQHRKARQRDSIVYMAMAQHVVRMPPRSYL
jgi:hypothetical protein